MYQWISLYIYNPLKRFRNSPWKASIKCLGSAASQNFAKSGSATPARKYATVAAGGQEDYARLEMEYMEEIETKLRKMISILTSVWSHVTNNDNSDLPDLSFGDNPERIKREEAMMRKRARFIKEQKNDGQPVEYTEEDKEDQAREEKEEQESDSVKKRREYKLYTQTRFESLANIIRDLYKKVHLSKSNTEPDFTLRLPYKPAAPAGGGAAPAAGPPPPPPPPPSKLIKKLV